MLGPGQSISPNLSGAMLLTNGSVIGLGFGLQSMLADAFDLSQVSYVLLTLILLTPGGALDWLPISFIAALASSRVSFARHDIVGPGLKFLAVCAVVVSHADVRWLAMAHVVAGVVGLLAYSLMLFVTLRVQGVIERITLRELKFPIKEIMGFGIPVFGGNVAILLRAFSLSVF